ncbi:lovastatin diketide synthase LovF [Coleophoma cylindrospora]|uniref:Lovastatin diketide synthase LovF n=1 Tax=Coleophoma cylindrospora TaxID=1849047 RepID=A0A3D8S1X4_9HELO|nr:lovastatin diketide synthase LovF [Coleophoma cylindrospora]
MPFLTPSSSSIVSIPSEGSDSSMENTIIDDKGYVALDFDGYTEKPLSEQLEPIAVVGMGCRLPGSVSSPGQFWDMMMNKRTAPHSKVPSSRFNIDAHLHPNNERPGSFNVPGGYFLDGDLNEFDPGLFNISPVEAMWMDPQQRKLLEVVYETFESAGVTLGQMENSKTAVFVGSFTSDFQQMSFKDPDFRHSYAATGVDPGLISARISHVFNLYGPSLTLNTACSSSVYALHQACNALRNKECSGAIAGGTNLVLTVDQHINTAKLGVLSPDSTCHTFDASANGYGRAEGVGAVYLKRLSDAIRDGDPIRAVVRSSAVNSNGKVPSVGITHPNLEGQVQVIRHAYERGGDLDPRLTGYFECHGTGTPIGDPLEVHAVAQAMNTKDADGIESLWIGAVKPNVGHSEAASGLSALIKAVLAVEKGIIPPVRGITKLNAQIDWNNWHVKVPCEPQHFPAHLPVRRVSVNSFGYGGTNGHFIVEGVESLVPGYSHGQKKVKGSERGVFHQKRPYLLPFSAHDKSTLLRNIDSYAKVVGDYNLLDLSYTLANRRSRLACRGFVVSSPNGIAEAFSNVAENFSFAEKKKAPVVGFAFTGQGAQWARMGYELMAYYPSFLSTIRRLDRVLGDLPNGPEWTLEDILQEDAAESRVNEAEFSQPLCTAIQVALVDLLESWGITPMVTVGHSSGEIGAAYAAGLVSFNEAISAAYFRGKVVSTINTNGAMMAVGLSAEATQPYLVGYEGRVVVACHNSPALVTLSGDADALSAVKQTLDKDQIFARTVKTGGKAYHSFHMKPAAAMYHDLMHEASSHMTHYPCKVTGAVMVSSVTNTVLASARPLDADYWCSNLVSPVQFNQAVQTIASEEAFKNTDLLLIEIGPHSALKGPVKQICREHKLDKISYLPTIERGGNSASQLLNLAGQLFLRNFNLDYPRITAIEQTSPAGKIQIKTGSLLVDLPTYQWNYSKALWAEPRQSKEHRTPLHARHDVLGRRMPGGSQNEPTWRNCLRQIDLPWLKHHSLGGEAVFPAAGYFGMAIEAVTQMNETSCTPLEITGYTLRDIAIKAALVIPDDNDGIETLFSLQPSVHADWWEFDVSSCSQDGHWNNHMMGTIGINVRAPGQMPRETPAMTQRATGKAWNQALKAVGFDYGPSFQDMQDVRTDGKRFHAAALSVVKKTSGLVEGESRYVMHPATIDSCLQLIIVSIYAGKMEDMTCGAVPIQVDEVSLWLPTEGQLQSPEATAYAWTDERGVRLTVNGAQLVGSDGQLLLSVENMRCVAYEAAVPQSRGAVLKEQPFMKMDWNIDIDTLTSESPVGFSGIEDLVAMAAWKNPGIKVLDFGGLNAVAVCQATELVDYTASAASTPELEALNNTIAGFDHATALIIDSSLELESQGLKAGRFDLILPGTFTDGSKLTWLLSPGGRVVADQPLCSSLGGNFSVLKLSNGLAIATAVGEQEKSSTNGVHERSITIVYRNKPTEIPCRLVKAVNRLGSSRLVRLSDVSKAASDHMIVACDLEGPLLLTLEPSELAGLQYIVSNTSSVTWVTAGGLMKGTTPEQAMASGAARSVTSEMASLDFTMLDLDLSSTTTDCAISEIVNALQRQIHHSKGKESEYCVANGLVYISRLVPDTALNQKYGPQNSTPRATPFNPSDKLVGITKAGKVTFAHDYRANQDLGADQVQVQVILSGVSKEDALVLEGADSLTTFSHEIYGTVVQRGANVQDISVGDRVFGFSADRLATFQTVSASMVQKAEPGDIPEELVTLPLAYTTALHGLTTLARIEEGEIVLILQGTGDSGAAAIAISKHMKARTYVAVQSVEEATKVARTFNLPAENVIPQLDPSLMMRLKERTGGRAADVIFSSAYVSPTVGHECWRQIAAFGRFIEIGRKTGLRRSALDPIPTHRGASYIAFDTLDLYRHKERLLSDYLFTTTSLYREKLIPAIGPIEMKNLTEFDTAILGFNNDFATKKTVIEYAESASGLVLPVIPHCSKLMFSPNATYFLVGCLGGLGRSLTAWMVDRGAKRFAFVSRSGLGNEQTAAWIRGLEAGGITCQIIKGDASKKSDVEAAIRSIPTAYPIKGVVHAAMVLRDGLFHSMTFDNWKTSIAPKVLAAINLDQAFAQTDLDFLVFTSSTSGILGTPGQANYAAGNSFLDNLARRRVANGQRAASLVLPMVQSVGVVAENPEIEAALRRKGIYGINETHLLESLEAAIATQATLSPADHVVVGMDPSKLKDSLAGSEVTDSFWTEDTRFKAVLQAINSSEPSDKGGAGFTIQQAIKEAGSLQAGVGLISEHFTTKLGRLLMLEPDVFEPEVLPIVDYGLDSMIGAELRNWIFKEYGLDIPFQQLLGPTMTIVRFAAVVCAFHKLV